MVFLALWEGRNRLTRRFVARTTGQRSDRPRLGTVIARRVLSRDQASQRQSIVRIGLPEPYGSGDWRCAYHIGGIGMRTPRYAFGVDSIQALILTLDAIRIDLEAAGTAFRWIGGELGDTGFPRYVSTAFGLVLSRRINRLIDRELSQHGGKLEAHARRTTRRRKS